MKLLVVRHAIAEDRDEFSATGQDDRLRPLTSAGARKMKRGARGLRTLVPSIDMLAASPLVRAAETAEILRNVYGLESVATVVALEPERPAGDVASWLATVGAAGVVAVVGHQPQLGLLVSYLIGAGDRSAVEMKKGGATLVEIEPNRDQPGQLIWSLPPKILRSLAG
jgi:phosphohistidine phosphatase